MAKIIENNFGFEPIIVKYSVFRVMLVGAILGAIYALLSLWLGGFLKSPDVVGKIVAVVVLMAGVFLMTYLRMEKALTISFCSGLIIFGLTGWTSGLDSLSSLLWDILIVCLAYLLFSQLARYIRAILVILIAVGILFFININNIL